jgi:hypothetical protein
VRGSSAPLRVLIVSYHFAPANESGTHRAIHFARSLHDAGHDVQVLAGHPTDASQFDEALTRVFPYPERIVRIPKQDSRPARLLAGLQKLLPHAGADRTVASPDQAGGEPGGYRTGLLAWPSQVYNAYESYPDVHRGWLRPAVQAGLRLSKESSFDAVVATGPPWTALRVAARLVHPPRTRFAVDFRDPWAWGTGGARRSPLVARLSVRLQRQILDAADLVLFNSRELCDTIGSESTARVVTVLNGSDMPRNSDLRVLSPDRRLIFRHFGSLYGDRSLRPLLEVLATAADWPEGLRPSLEQFGFGSESALPSGMGVQVRSRPAVPFSQAVMEMNRAAILVVVQPDRFRHQIPTKTYDYLCTGNPILVLSPEQSAVWSLAAGFERCVRADPANPVEIRRVVQNLLEEWQAGTLFQVPADDTYWLTKSVLNEEFVAEIEAICQRERTGVKPEHQS